MANFVSNDNATSLMNAINQKKDSKPGTITWAEWIALTDEQREGTHYIITNVPAKFSDKDAVFSIKDQTLTFTNKTATVADSRITSDTYIFTFYHNQAVAQAAGIECSWTTGTVTFTVDENPSENIVVDILCILPALATPPSEGGGHVIQNQSGNAMTQEDAMQFLDAHLTDDPINGRTIVENIKEVDPADYDSTTDEGIIVCDDGNDVPIGEIEEDVVSVKADGVKTYGQLLNELYALIDENRLSKGNSFVEFNNAIFHYMWNQDRNKILNFTLSFVTDLHTNLQTIVISSASRYSDSSDGNITDYTNTVATSGAVITLHYGTSSGIVELNTDARHCMMSDGVTSVEDMLTVERLSGFDVYSCYKYGKIIEVSIETTPSAVTHGSVIVAKIPRAHGVKYISLNMSSGQSLNCVLENVPGQNYAQITAYYPGAVNIGRIDETLMYIGE